MIGIFYNDYRTLAGMYKDLIKGFEEYNLIKSYDSFFNIHLVNGEHISFIAKEAIGRKGTDGKRFSEAYIIGYTPEEKLNNLKTYMEKENIYILEYDADETWLSLFKSFMTKKRYKS